MSNAIITDQANKYYVVYLSDEGQYPKDYIVLAQSDFHAAQLVKQMTGRMPASEKDVMGPYYNHPAAQLQQNAMALN